MFFVIQLIIHFLLSTSAEKFCINCKHFRPSLFSDNSFGKCSIYPREMSNKIDYLVTGKPNKEYSYCSTARIYENMCGSNGRNYETKINFLKNYMC